jgi:predicted nucleotidyltransferase
LLRERLREILRGTSTEDLGGPLEEPIGELVGKLDPVAVVVAGSLAKGWLVRGLSDVDVLVVVDRPVRNEERFSLAPLGARTRRSPSHPSTSSRGRCGLATSSTWTP